MATDQPTLEELQQQLGPYQVSPPATFRSNLAAGLQSLPIPSTNQAGAGARFVAGLAHGFASAQQAAMDRENQIRAYQNSLRLKASQLGLEAAKERSARITPEEHARQAGLDATAVEAAKRAAATRFPIPTYLEPYAPANAKDVNGEELGKMIDAYKAEHPASMFGANLGPMTPEETAAQLRILQAGGPMLFNTRTNPQAGRQVLQLESQQPQGQDFGSVRAWYSGQKASLGKLQQSVAFTEGYGKKLRADANNARELLKGMPDSGLRILNQPLRDIYNAVGSKKANSAQMQMYLLATEANKIVNGTPTLTGQTALADREEMRDFMNARNLTVGQMFDLMDRVIFPDLANRTHAFNNQMIETAANLTHVPQAARQRQIRWSDGRSDWIPDDPTIAEQWKRVGQMHGQTFKYEGE